MTTSDQIYYEHAPDGSPMDETDVAVRAHLSRMSDEKLREYDPNWTDEQLMEWDGNFRSDGALMLVCTERDFTAVDYRAVMAEHLELRGIHSK
jgi:hypothetical protein